MSYNDFISPLRDAYEGSVVDTSSAVAQGTNNSPPSTSMCSFRNAESMDYFSSTKFLLREVSMTSICHEARLRFGGRCEGRKRFRSKAGLARLMRSCFGVAQRRAYPFWRLCKLNPCADRRPRKNVSMTNSWRKLVRGYQSPLSQFEAARPRQSNKQRPVQPISAFFYYRSDVR